MRDNDLIADQDELKAHQHEFFLWPRLWETCELAETFTWIIHPFKCDQTENIPAKPGVYSFVIKPGIVSHPESSYLMYVGKTERTLRERFKEYFIEQRNMSRRPKIVRLLNKYQGYLFFCCSVVKEAERIGRIEEALIRAYLPPCNDQFPANVRRVVGAFQ